MAFTISVNHDDNHTLTFSKNTLARRNEANVSVTVVVPAAVFALGSFAYVDFILPDGSTYFKGDYDPSSGSFTFTLGSADTILSQDGRIGIQFVLRDSNVLPTVVWKSELKYALVGGSADATAQALTGIPSPATFPATFPATNVSIVDAGTYFASPDVEDALQEVGASIEDLEDGTVPSGDSTLAFGLTKTQLFAEYSLLIYPVGSIYISVGSTSPATLFGGTWSVFGAGRTLVGIDSVDADFDTVEETGGAKTHTLAETEIPSHTHTYDLESDPGLGTEPFNPAAGTGTLSDNFAITTASGGGLAHNNLQPYIVVRMWKRTS